MCVGCRIGYDIFGVFDGHGGKQAANFASKHVLPILQNELAGANINTDTALPEGLWEYTELPDEDKLAWQMQDTMVQCLPTALVSTFRKVQDQFHANTQVCYGSATIFFSGTKSTQHSSVHRQHLPSTADALHTVFTMHQVFYQQVFIKLGLTSGFSCSTLCCWWTPRVLKLQVEKPVRVSCMRCAGVWLNCDSRSHCGMGPSGCQRG